ncbi:MAG: hypothetical protein V4503_01605 [Gemmatimonadota bacterium]
MPLITEGARRRLLAGLRITTVIAVFWTAALVLIRLVLGIGQSQPMSEFWWWLGNGGPNLAMMGLLLGAFYATGLVVLRPRDGATRFSGVRSALVGALGGVCLVAVMIFLSWKPGATLTMETLLSEIRNFAAVGALTGLGVWRIARRGASPAIDPAVRDLTTRGATAALPSNDLENILAETGRLEWAKPAESTLTARRRD